MFIQTKYNLKLKYAWKYIYIQDYLDLQMGSILKDT